MKHVIEIFKGHVAGPNGCHMLSELRKWHRNSIFNRFIQKISFHYLLCFTFDTLLISRCPRWLLCLLGLVIFVLGLFLEN